MITRIRLAVLFTCAMIVLSLFCGVHAAERPNVVLIMADDLGYNDLSCYGGQRIRTPELDKLAHEGIRLSNFYTGATVCTPSRMALMTGAYPVRVGWPGGVLGFRIPTTNGLAPEALTMAEVFRDAGYATGISGKWHLGNASAMSPMAQGFDSAFYIKMSNNQTKKLWRGEELIANPFDNRRLTERFTREAIKFIKTHHQRPFFLYIPFTAPHFPAQAHPDWEGKSSNDAYGDVVEELDSRVGKILDTLRTLKIERKTIVVFLSDNGPDPSQRRWASAKPLRGMKWSSLEGGTRVPCIIRWPGVIPARQVCDRLTAAIDLLPTLAHACDIELPERAVSTPKIDGINVWNTLIGKKDTPHPRTNLLYWNGWAKLEAIRVGTWKLYLTEVKDVPGSESQAVLFDLASDPTEEVNVAEDHPEKISLMRELVESWIADLDTNSIPLGGPPLRKQ